MKIADLPAAIPSSQSVSRAAQRNFRTSFSAELTRARTGNGLKSIEAADQAGQLQPVTYSVKAGDTLTSIARQWIKKNGGDATEPAIARVIQTISKASGISNPDVIRIGQVLVMTKPAISARTTELRPPAPSADSAQPRDAKAATAVNAVMEKMLSRAVTLQYVDASQKDAVRQKLLDIAQNYGVQPDDLARIMLMESDGMNPKATNGSCHGVIQFCEGENRGAAAVGYGKNPKAILGLGVLDQLDLVRRYFDETGLKNLSPASLDDLYLTVLKPAARVQRDPNANLEIPGAQALALYPGNDRSQPITRTSLLAGLHRTAQAKLASLKDSVISLRSAPSTNATKSMRRVSLGATEQLGQDESL